MTCEELAAAVGGGGSGHNSAGMQVAENVCWPFRLDVLHTLNKLHSNFQGVFFQSYRALLAEEHHENYVLRLADFIRSMKSQHMFVRVERPPRSKRFVLAYLKCERVFSFAIRFEQMRLRLNQVPRLMLSDMENEEDKELRLACLGKTDQETDHWESDLLKIKGVGQRSLEHFMSKGIKSQCDLKEYIENNDREHWNKSFKRVYAYKKLGDKLFSGALRLIV
jgi:hypothetical protein